MKTPEVFYLARPVFYDGTSQNMNAIVDATCVFEPSSWNCWHVFLFSGALKGSQRFFPFSLPLVSWERKNRLRVYPYQQLSPHLT